MRTPLLSLVALLALPLGCASARPAPPVAEAPHASRSRGPTEARHVYRLDFVLAAADGALAGSYSLNVEEDMSAELHDGSNVQLTPQSRADVGIKLWCSYALVGDDLLLRSKLEMSSMQEGGAMRKLASDGETLLSPGKASLVTSMQDPVAHAKMTLTVTATKLR